MGGPDVYPHALLVPASAQGHVNGCVLLARALAALGFKVSFVYFSSYYAKLKSKNRLSHTQDGGDPSDIGTQTSPLSNQTTVTTLAPRSTDGNGGSGGGDNLTSNQASTTFSSGGVEGNLSTSSHITGDRSRGGGPCDRGMNTDPCDRGMIQIHVIEDEFAPGDVDKHFFVTPAMKENLFSLILQLREQGTPPTCLISETFLPWTLHVAERAGIPRIDYCASNAMAYLLLTYLPCLFSQGILPEKGSPTQWKRETPLMLDHIPGLLPFSSKILPSDIRFADPSSPSVNLLMEVSSCVKSGERILIHTMSELEPDAFQVFQAEGIPAYAIGPLLHHLEKQEDTPASSQAKEKSALPAGVSQLNEQTGCISWLDMQAESSVIYIAFGSFARLSVEEIQELAMGVEASGNPFLWVIREDSHGGAELPQVLSDGFLERTSTQGLIISWAPQMEVLEHKAIGGFLTHCGWNSTIESMWTGVPLLCCPRHAEQRSNCHYICNVWGVGLELGRTNIGGLERSCVQLGVKALMQDEEGLKARGKAQEVMHHARKTCQPGGQSFTSLQKFYDDMKVLCSTPSSHYEKKESFV